MVCIWVSERRIPHSNLQTMRIMFACVYGIRVCVTLSLSILSIFLLDSFGISVFCLLCSDLAPRQSLELSVWANDNNNNHRMRPCKIRSATLTIEMWAVPHMTRSHSVAIVCRSNRTQMFQHNRRNEQTIWYIDYVCNSCIPFSNIYAEQWRAFYSCKAFNRTQNNATQSSQTSTLQTS